MWTCIFFQKIAKRMRRGYSPVVLFTGITGTGKTCLSALLSEYVSWVISKKRWDVREFCVFDMKQLSFKYFSIKKTPLVVAEAGYDLGIDDWRSPANVFFDKVLQTQRVKGNLYSVNIPNAKDLAARQRRKIDWVVEVRKHGYAKVYKVKIDRKTMAGNEFRLVWYWDLIGYPLPVCHNELKKMDEENKERILKELIDEHQESERKIEEDKKEKPPTQTYKCPHCGDMIPRRKKSPRRCAHCQKPLKLEDLKPLT